jgi:drug/metabolite transporter (DMT)-like permease
MGVLSSRRPALPPLLVLLFGILTISTGSLMVRYAQGYAPSPVIAAYRLALATLFLAPIALTRHWQELKSLTRSELALAGLSGFFLAIHFATWITSLEYTSVASSVVLVTTTPLWVALLTPFTIKEPLSRPVLMGMALALVGVMGVGLSDTCRISQMRIFCPGMETFFEGKAILGDLLATSGAIVAAAYVLIGRRLRIGLSLVGYTFLVYGAAAIFLVTFMLISSNTPVGYPSQAYTWFLLLALVPQLMGHSSFNWALGYVSAALVSVALLCEPVGATLLAYLLLGETPTILKLFGAILILIGVYIAARGERYSLSVQ